jgi:hypothetical protein
VRNITDKVTHHRQLEICGNTMDLGNGIGLAAAVTGSAPAISAVGDDSNVDLTIAAKGTGRVRPAAGQQYLTTGPNVAGGATLTLTEALHNGKIINLDTAAGTTVTLPAATGSGARYRFVVTVVATSNSHIIKVANVNDAMQGFIFTMSDDPVTVKGFFAVAGTSDTITLNRTTTGSVTKGEMIEIIDIAANVFQVSGFTSSTGTEATPFSATV